MNKLKVLVCNSADQGRFVQVINRVDSSTIRRETDEDGDTYIYVPSYTLPDDVVMNNGLYPKAEIEASYKSLEDTPAPVGHPTDSNGNFASASSHIGIDKFHVGAWNVNVQRKGNRIYLEKRINERVAMQSELGQKLMARLNSILNGEDVEPIHTSVGVFVEIQNKKGVINNQSYDWVASNMEFDHDAILLDEIGAATPEDGVGLMVNKGRELVVNRAINNFENSVNDTLQLIQTALRESLVTDEECWVYVEDWNMNADGKGGEVVYFHDHELFKQQWALEGDTVVISGEPEKQVRRTVYQAANRAWGKICALFGGVGASDKNIGHGGRDSKNKQGEMMNRETIIKLLMANGVKVDENATDDQLEAQLEQALKANQADDAEDDGSGDLATQISEAVANAVKPISDKLEALETKQNAEEEDEKSKLREKLKNDYDEDELKGMSLKTLKKLAGNQNAGAFHVNTHFKPQGDNDLSGLEMPSKEIN